MSSRPKAKSGKSPATEPSLFVLNYKTRRVLVGTPTSHDQLQLSIRRHFPEIPNTHRVSYHTKNLVVCEGALTEISPDIWGAAIPLLNSVTVLSEPMAVSSANTKKRPAKEPMSDLEYTSCDESNNNPNPPLKKLRSHTVQSKSTVPRAPPIPLGRRNMTLNIHKGGERLIVKCHHSMSISNILSEIHLTSRYHDYFRLDDFRVLYNGSHLREDECEYDSVGDLGMTDGTVIEVIQVLKGGKPVIYLFPPAGNEVDATVTLSLVPEWHLSAIYPVVPIKALSCGGQTLQWEVKASSDGTLLEKTTELEVAYLFWEAEALVAFPMRNHEQCPEIPEPFIPNQPRVDPANSVVLEVANMTPYVDSALKALGLHTEARTSFITYWLPSFLRYKYVALRFLSQSAYEHAAPLEVSPAPDVVVRVFMLFKGLKGEDVASGNKWSNATEMAKGDAAFWRKVVGVDENSSLADESLFRVVEWGGMEVLS